VSAAPGLASVPKRAFVLVDRACPLPVRCPVHAEDVLPEPLLAEAIPVTDGRDIAEPFTYFACEVHPGLILAPFLDKGLVGVVVVGGLHRGLSSVYARVVVVGERLLPVAPTSREHDECGQTEG